MSLMRPLNLVKSNCRQSLKVRLLKTESMARAASLDSPPFFFAPFLSVFFFLSSMRNTVCQRSSKGKLLTLSVAGFRECLNLLRKLDNLLLEGCVVLVEGNVDVRFEHLEGFYVLANIHDVPLVQTELQQ